MSESRGSLSTPRPAWGLRVAVGPVGEHGGAAPSRPHLLVVVVIVIIIVLHDDL